MSHDISLFVMVEGKIQDRYFVDTICASSQPITKAGYEVRQISTIETEEGTATGGKAALVSFFDYCKQANKLAQKNSSGWKQIAFIADRDAQHLTGGRRRSTHFIYTRYADSEAHIFFESKEKRALAVAASLDHDEVEELITFLGNWRESLARDWRPWIELCCVAEAVLARTPRVGFGKPWSLVHIGTDHRTFDPAAFADASQAVKNTSLFDEEKYIEVRESIMEKIDQIYAKGNGFSLLKGKWLPSQLELLVAKFFIDPDGTSHGWNSSGFKDSVTRCYAANLDVTKPGNLQIRTKLEALV